MKSIWFLHCELDLQGETIITDTYYQVKMLSIVEWKSLDQSKLLTTSEILDFLDSISWSRLKYNLRNINLRGNTICVQNEDIEVIEAKIGKVIIIQDTSILSTFDQKRLAKKQYKYWLSKISNLAKDDQIYQSHN